MKTANRSFNARLFIKAVKKQRSKSNVSTHWHTVLLPSTYVRTHPPMSVDWWLFVSSVPQLWSCSEKYNQQFPALLELTLQRERKKVHSRWFLVSETVQVPEHWWLQTTQQTKIPCLRGIPISGDHKFIEGIKIKVKWQPVTKEGGIILYGMVRKGDPRTQPTVGSWVRGRHAPGSVSVQEGVPSEEWGKALGKENSHSPRQQLEKGYS